MIYLAFQSVFIYDFANVNDSVFANTIIYLKKQRKIRILKFRYVYVLLKETSMCDSNISHALKTVNSIYPFLSLEQPENFL